MNVVYYVELRREVEEVEEGRYGRWKLEDGKEPRILELRISCTEAPAWAEVPQLRSDVKILQDTEVPQFSFYFFPLVLPQRKVSTGFPGPIQRVLKTLNPVLQVNRRTRVSASNTYEERQVFPSLHAQQREDFLNLFAVLHFLSRRKKRW